jgi:hypothetical protein
MVSRSRSGIGFGRLIREKGGAGLASDAPVERKNKNHNRFAARPR